MKKHCYLFFFVFISMNLFSLSINDLQNKVFVAHSINNGEDFIKPRQGITVTFGKFSSNCLSYFQYRDYRNKIVIEAEDIPLLKKSKYNLRFELNKQYNVIINLDNQTFRNVLFVYRLKNVHSYPRIYFREKRYNDWLYKDSFMVSENGL